MCRSVIVEEVHICLCISCVCLSPPQTVKVSSVEKLTRYVEGSQLTSDFGGFLPYDHNQWLSLRQVRMVKLTGTGWVNTIIRSNCSDNL